MPLALRPGIPTGCNRRFEVVAVFTNALIVELDSRIGGVHDAVGADLVVSHYSTS